MVTFNPSVGIEKHFTLVRSDVVKVRSVDVFETVSTMITLGLLIQLRPSHFCHQTFEGWPLSISRLICTSATTLDGVTPSHAFGWNYLISVSISTKLLFGVPAPMKPISLMPLHSLLIIVPKYPFVYPLIIFHIAIENGRRHCEFSH